MNLTKIKKVVAAGLSALMMMTSTTSVFAAESGDKSANLNYQVNSVYEWVIHSAVDFGNDAGIDKEISRDNNQVKVLKNIIPERSVLRISVKGSGDNGEFTISNGKSKKLHYSAKKSDNQTYITPDTEILDVPSGTNTAVQNLDFELSTTPNGYVTSKTAEIAGSYTGNVIYTAEVNSELRNGSIINIGGHKYIIVNVDDTFGDLYCTLMSTEKIYGSTILNGKSTDGLTSYEINALVNDYLNDHKFEILPFSSFGSTHVKSSIYSKNNSIKDSKDFETCLYPISVQEYNDAFGSIGYAINGNGLYHLLNDYKDMWSRDSYENDNGKGITYYGMSGVVRRDTRELSSSYVLPCFKRSLSNVKYTMIGDVRDRVDYFE